MEGLGVFFLFDEAGEALEEFADVDGGAVEVEEAFEEDADGEEAAAEEEVNERASFVDEMDHDLSICGLAFFVPWSKWTVAILRSAPGAGNIK